MSTPLESMSYDLRYALRQLRQSPGFAVTAILTLALGIGVSAAMFSVIDAVILHALPYKNVDRIVQVKTRDVNFHHPQSWPEYQDMRRLNSTFSVLAGIRDDGGVTLSQGNQAIYLHSVRGTDNFFDLYGVKPLLGRTYLPGEDQNGRNDVVVLSYEVWQQSFGGEKNVVGKIVHLDGAPTTVIGVMPAGFRVRFDARNVVYTPLHLSAIELKSRGAHWLPIYGRLKPGVTLAQAHADMNYVLAEMNMQFPAIDKGMTAQIIPIVDSLHTNQYNHNDRPVIWLLLAAVFAVLLIACINVAGLLLARGMLREREMALRAALGAGRRRLASQTLTESVLLGLGGGVAGIILENLLLAAMQQFLAKAFQCGGNVHLNLPVLAATLVLAVVSSIAVGLVPAWHAVRMDPNRALKAGGNAGTTRQQHRLRSSFVVVQVALSVMLLLCSGLLLLGLRGMLLTDLGYNPKHLLTLEVDIPAADYTGRDFVQTLVQPLEASVQSIPGVMAVGSNDLMPIQESGWNDDLSVVGKPVDPYDKPRLTEIRFVTPGYFAAMQLPILKGRDLTAQDVAKTQPVAVVNDAWVKEFLGKNEDPLVQAFVGVFSGEPHTVIVGVAGSGRQDIMQPPMPEADFPMTQMSQSWYAFVPNFYLFIRTSVPPESIIPQLRSALHNVAPNVAFRTPETMEEVLDDARVTNRMLSWLFGIFAAIAVLLTAIGIYGLLSQEVASRSRDIGIRMALGETRNGVARLVLVRTILLLGMGTAIGLAGVLLARQLLSALLTIQFMQDGWAAVVATALILAAIGLVAAYIPARRAASIDPMQALRSE